MCISGSTNTNDKTVTQTEVKLQYRPPVLKNNTYQDMRYGTETHHNGIIAF